MSVTKPTIGQQNWGPILNAALDALDTSVAGKLDSATASATYEAGHAKIIYVDPAGSNSNSGLIQALPKLTLAAALTALASSGGEVRLTPNATFTLTSGLTWDASKIRVVGKRTKLDFTAMTSGTAIALTASSAGTVAYANRSAKSPLEGVDIAGSSRTNSVTGLSLAATTGNELAHLRVTSGVALHGFGTGLSLGDNVHNVEFDIDIYDCGHCIDDTAATANAGERIVFNGGAFFNSLLVGYLHNGNADYSFSSCSFDYNVAQFDINGAVVTCNGCHTEGNDANYSTNYPFTVSGTGTLTYLGGILTGSLTTIPAYVHTGASTARAAFIDTRVNGWTGTFWDGTGNVVKTSAQTNGDTGCVYSTTDRAASNGVVSTIALGTAKWDTGGFYAGGNPNRISAPQTGFYLVVMKIQMAAVAGGTWRQAWLALNGNDASEKACPRSYPVNTLIQDAQSEIVFLNQGDYYELHVYQDSGSSVTITAANGGPEISLTRVA